MDGSNGNGKLTHEEMQNIKRRFLHLPNVAGVQEVRGELTVYVHDVDAWSEDARGLASKHNIPILPKTDQRNVIL